MLLRIQNCHPWKLWKKRQKIKCWNTRSLFSVRIHIFIGKVIAWCITKNWKNFELSLNITKNVSNPAANVALWMILIRVTSTDFFRIWKTKFAHLSNNVFFIKLRATLAPSKNDGRPLPYCFGWAWILNVFGSLIDNFHRTGNPIEKWE